MRSHASGFDGDLDTVFSRGAMVSGAAMLIGTVGGGLLGQLDLSIPFVARSGLLALAFVLALLGMRDLGFHARPLTLETLRRELASVAEGRPALRLEPALAPAADAARLRCRAASSSGASTRGSRTSSELLETDAVWFAGVVAAGVAAVDHGRQRRGRPLRAPVRQAHHAAGVGGEHPDVGGDRRRPVAELPDRVDLPARW